MPARGVVRPRRAGTAAPAGPAPVDVSRLPTFREAHEAGYAAGRDQGLAEGRERGLAEGRAQAQDEAVAARQERDAADAAERATRDARFEALSRSLDERLDAALAAVRARAAADAAEVAALAVELAVELVGRELAHSDDVVVGNLERALRLAPEADVVVVRVHPDDLGLVTLGRPGLTVVGDLSVEPGGCVLAADDAVVDAQVGAAVARLREAAAELVRESGGRIAGPGAS